MDRRRAAGALLALAACIATSAAAPTAGNNTALDLYDEHSEGCYYNFQHYGEGDRIMTNEPCLNCTCHNRMLMCYLRVCPFTKAIGQDCTVEKRADQCCPIVTCPDVPVDLLTSTSTSSPAEYGGTGLGKVDNYGCSINGKYFPEGAKVPPTPNKPCEHCYCIRNMTTCVMQECTLHVDGCTPIYHKDVCCPVRYFCDHPEDEMPALDDMTTTVRPTPGFLLTTTPPTEEPTTLPAKRDCIEDDQLYSDGALIKREKPCEHCYCMKGDIVCVVQECGTPMENEGKNCTSLPPREGQCCPDTYICEGDELSTEPSTNAPLAEVTTLVPPRRVSVEGSGYRNDDELPYTEVPTFMPDIEGSGEEDFTQTPVDSNKLEPEKETTEKVLDDRFATEDGEFIPKTTQASLTETPEVPPKVIENEETTRKDDIEVTEKPPAEEQETTSKYDATTTEPTFIAESTKPSADTEVKESSSTGETASEPSSSEAPSKSDQDAITETPNIETIKTTVQPSDQELVKETSEPPVATTQGVENETVKLEDSRRTSPVLVMETTKSSVNTGDDATAHTEGTTEIPGFEETTPKPSDIDIETDQNTVPVETEEATQPSKVDKLSTDEELELPSSTITPLTSDEISSISYDRTTTSSMEQTEDLTVQSEEELAHKTESSTPVSKEDEYIATTVPAFRKEDEATTSAEIATHKESEEESPSTEAVVTPSYEEPTTEKSTSHVQELDATTIPVHSGFDEITAPKETTTESLIELSTFAHEIEKETVTSQENVISQGETTTVNPEDNEIEEVPSPGRIPGEGDCLLDGVTFKNDSMVPSNNKCYSDCKCISSIIKCDPIICSPPPEYMDNCQPRYDAPDSCCPTYICDHGKETIPPESHSHMAGTESPVPSPSIDCNGDQCEVTDKESQPTVPPKTPERVGSEDCESESCKSAPQIPVQTYPEGCTGSQCTLPAESCTNGECEMSSQPVDRIGPTEASKPCASAEGCGDVSVPVHCEGDSCLPEIKTPQEISQECQDEESCKNDVPEISSTSCDGVQCDQKPENIPSKDSISDNIPQPCENEDDCKQSQVPDTVIPVSLESETNQPDKICLEENGCKTPDEATGEEHIDKTKFTCTSTECLHQKPITPTDTVASSETLSTDEPISQEQSTPQTLEHVDETLTTLPELPASLPETIFETTTTGESKISITDDRFTTTPVPGTVSVEYSSATTKEPATTSSGISDSSPQQDNESELDEKLTGKPELDISTETPKDTFDEEPESTTKSADITKSPEESSSDQEQTTVSSVLSTVSDKEKLPEQEPETDEKITELPSQVTEKDSELPKATTEQVISVTEPHKVETETKEIAATDTQITTESPVKLDDETSTSDYEIDQTASIQDVTETNRPVLEEDESTNLIPDRSGGEEEPELHTGMPPISEVTETSINDTEMKEPVPTEISESDLMVIQTTSVPFEETDTESPEETGTKSPEETITSQEPERTEQETETKAPEEVIPDLETETQSPADLVPSLESETEIPDKIVPETETKGPEEAIPEHETETQSPTETVPSQESETEIPDKTAPETETKAPEELIPEQETETQSPTETVPSQESETEIPDKMVPGTETRTPEEVIPEVETETQSPIETVPPQESETETPDKTVPETETKTPEDAIPEQETETQSPTKTVLSQESETTIPGQETETKAPEEPIPEHVTEIQSPTEMVPDQETGTKEPHVTISEKESDVKESDETQTELPDKTTVLYESETKAPEVTISSEESSSEESVTKTAAEIIPTKETETSDEVISSEETPTTSSNDIIPVQHIGTIESEKTISPEETFTTEPQFVTESPESSTSSLLDEKEKATESPMSLVTKIQQIDSTTPQLEISSESNVIQTTSQPEKEILREDGKHTDKPKFEETEKPATDANYPVVEEQAPVTEKQSEDKPEINSVEQDVETEQPALISVPVDEPSLPSQESTKEPAGQKEPDDNISQTTELPADVLPESTSAEPAVSSVPPETINTVGIEASTEVSHEETTLGQDHTQLDLETHLPEYSTPEITEKPTSEIEQPSGPDTEEKVTDKPELHTEIPDVPKATELPDQMTTEQSYFTETQKIEPASETTQMPEKESFEDETTDKTITQGPYEAEGTTRTAEPTFSKDEQPTETTKIDSEQQSKPHKEEQLPTESIPIDSTQSLIDNDNTPTEPTQTTKPELQFSETTPFLVELEEHTHKIDVEAPSSETPSEVSTISHEDDVTEKLPSSDLQTESPVIESETSSIQKDEISSEESTTPSTQYIGSEMTTESTHLTQKPISEISPETSEPSKPIDQVGPEEDKASTPKQVLPEEELTTLMPSTEAEKSPVEMPEKEVTSPKPQSVPVETTAPEEEFIPVTVKATTTKSEEEASTQSPQFDKTTKLEEKPSEISTTTPASDIAKPDELQPTDEIPVPEDESHFPPSGGYNQEPDYGDEDQAFGPGTCRYGGKVYVSAQQIPRDDPCDFCFCFRSDIICLQQSCPPPIHGCHEEPIQGFCCPRYECPVSMATTLNVTTTTTTTTTTLPPHFLPHAYKGAAQRRGCQIKGHTYKVGEVVRASSGPCLHCTCGGDGQMKCDPKACTPEPMLRQMIAAAVSSKRRR